MIAFLNVNATVAANSPLSAALPAMAASSGEARLTGAFEVNRDQFKRDPVVGLITKIMWDEMWDER